MRCKQYSEFNNVSLKWGMQLVWSADLSGTSAAALPCCPHRCTYRLSCSKNSCSVTTSTEGTEAGTEDYLRRYLLSCAKWCTTHILIICIFSMRRTHLLATTELCVVSVAGWRGWWPGWRLAPPSYCCYEKQKGAKSLWDFMVVYSNLIYCKKS